MKRDRYCEKMRWMRNMNKDTNPWRVYTGSWKYLNISHRKFSCSYCTCYIEQKIQIACQELHTEEMASIGAFFLNLRVLTTLFHAAKTIHELSPMLHRRNNEDNGKSHPPMFTDTDDIPIFDLPTRRRNSGFSGVLASLDEHSTFWK